MDEKTLRSVARSLSKKYNVNVVVTSEEESGGVSAKTDKRNIYLDVPKKMIGQTSSAVLRGLLDHEVGHILYHSDNGVAREIQRTYGNRGLYLLNALEDVRVDNAISKYYPGSKKNLDASMKEAVDGFLTTHTKYGESEGVDLSEVILGMMLTGEGHEVPDWFNEESKRMVESYRDEVQRAANAKNTREVAEVVMEILEGQGELPPEQKHQQQDGGEQEEKGEQGEKKEGGQSGPSGSNGKGQGKSRPQQQPQSPKPKEESKQQQREQPSEVPKPRMKDQNFGGVTRRKLDRAFGRQARTENVKSVSAKMRRDEKEKRAAKRYVESVGEGGRVPGYKLIPGQKKMDQVVYASGTYYDNISKAAGEIAGAKVQKLVQTLTGKEKSWWQGEKERGRLDPKTLTKFVTSSSQKIFRQREQVRNKPAAVAFSIDTSGSMSGERIQTALATAYVLGEAMDRSGIPFGVFGWSTADRGGGWVERKVTKWCHNQGENLGDYRTVCLTQTTYKGFHESFRRVKRRFNSTSVSGGTPMAEGMQYAIDRLNERKEARKILMVLTDGEPTQCSFNEDSYDHAKEVIRRAEDQGIEVFLIGYYKFSAEYMRPDIAVTVWSPKELADTAFDEVMRRLNKNDKKKVNI